MRKKYFKCIAALMSALVIVLGAPLVSYAAPQTMPDGATFDPEYYAAMNPDVVAALGTDVSTLYAHYLLFGKNEGRLPYEVTAATPVAVISPLDIYGALAASDGYAWIYEDPSSGYLSAYSFDNKGGYVEITHAGSLINFATVGVFSVATGSYLPAKIDYEVGAIDKNAVYLYYVSRATTNGKTTVASNKTTAYKIVGFDGTNLILEVKSGYGVENRVFTKSLSRF